MNAASTQQAPGETRRPFALRDSPLFQFTARLFANLGISPNQISLASIACSLIAAALIILLSQHPTLPLALGGTACILLRGSCNLLDGLVAVENGKAKANGAFFNEVPDRIADTAILTSLGLAYSLSWMGLSIGLTLSLLALGTAYLRAFSKTLINEEDFSGPAAKPQRMLLTAAALPFIPFYQNTLLILITILTLGTVVTLLRRTGNTLHKLQS